VAFGSGRGDERSHTPDGVSDPTHTTGRDSRAVLLKLDELLRATTGARDDLIGAEQRPRTNKNTSNETRRHQWAACHHARPANENLSIINSGSRDIARA